MASASKIPKYTKQYTFESPHHQEFSLPETFIQYLAQNWSGAVYEKLIQSCKYFFPLHQIIPIKRLASDNLAYDDVSCYIFEDEISVDLKEYKVWVYDCIESSDECPPYLFSSFLKSVYRCTPTVIDLWSQDIEVEDFVKISTNIKDISMIDTTFFYPDKTEASLWDTLTLLLKIEHCSVFDEKRCIWSSIKDITIPVLPNLKEFYFTKLPKYDFPVFAEFIKLHPNTKFEIEIKENIERIDIDEFEYMLEKTFPYTFITQYGEDDWRDFEWTLKSQYVRVELG